MRNKKGWHPWIRLCYKNEYRSTVINEIYKNYYVRGKIMIVDQRHWMSDAYLLQSRHVHRLMNIVYSVSL